LARAAGRAGQRIAKLVDSSYVGAIEEIEGVGDNVNLEALAEGDAPGNAHIHLEKIRGCKTVPAQISRWICAFPGASPSASASRLTLSPTPSISSIAPT